MLQQIVQPDQIEAVWSKVGMLEESEAMGLIDEIGEVQPALLEYLMSVPEEFTDAEAEQMLYIGVVLFKIMQKYSSKINMISAEELVAIEDENIAIMEQLEGESEGDGIAVIETLLNNYSQPFILASISEALIMDEDEEDIDEEDEISDEARGTMMLVLKTALDAMNKHCV